MDYFTQMLPYFFKYEGAEIVFTSPYTFDIIVKNIIVETINLK